MTNTLNAPEEFFQSVAEKATAREKQDACSLLAGRVKAMNRLLIDRIELEGETINPVQICDCLEIGVAMLSQIEAVAEHPVQESR